jgi:hypothetical protein
MVAASRSIVEMDESFRRIASSFRVFRAEIVALGVRFEAEYVTAFARDPGLEAAWTHARGLDPDIGWLDVARVRDAAWWEIAPGTRLP